MAATDRARLYDIGVIFQVTLQDKGVVIDLTGNTVLEFIFRKPSGVRLTVTPTVSGTPTLGVLQYPTVTGNLDELGEWNLQVHIVLPSGDFRSEVGNFFVDPAI